MSNLSELLPAGAGAKSATFVASGTLASGQTVALKTDGTVSAISAQVSSDSVFESAQTLYLSSTFDSANNKVVIFYSDYGNSQYGTAIVGTVSGTAISFGTPVVFNSADHNNLSATFDNNANKNIVVYTDGGASNNGKAIVGTVSGTSISFGSEGTFNAASTTNIGSAFDSTANKVVVAFRDDGNSDYGTAVVGTVSGTSISFGSEAVFETNQTSLHSLAYDPDENKTVLNYRHDGASGHGKSRVGTVSGTSISFGSAVTFNAASTTSWISSVYDTTNNKIVVGYTDGGNSSLITGIVGTVSGTSISFGTSQIIGAGILGNTSLSFDSGNNKVNFFYYYQASPYSGNIVAATVSGTSISFATPFVVQSTQIDGAGNMTSVYDSNAGRVVAAYRHIANSQYGTANVIDFAGNPSSNFIGITDEAISSAASGSVIVQGGVSDKATAGYAFSFGGASVFESATVVDISSTFDSNTNKIVIAYKDGGNSNYGTAIIGTVSGTSISFGTPTVFATHSVQYVSTVYDPDTQNIIISYRNASVAASALAVVGSVSGTSISFGTAVQYAASSVFTQGIVYDTTNDKVVIVYDDATVDATSSIVGTVSGTSISFGAAVAFNSGRVSYVSAAYDVANGKIVTAYTENSQGKARVGTVSGTSISFGSAVNFSSGNLFYPKTIYDVANEKILIAYRDSENSNYGTAIVGTVSGTSISFGSSAVFYSGLSQVIQGAYDSTNNLVILSYADGDNSNYGNTVSATISGTSVSFGQPAIFNSATTNGGFGAFVSYDSNSEKIVYAFTDGGNSNYGTAIVANGTADLVINTDYFVQSDGTLSTTSSTVPAGRALSTTSMLLEG